MTDTVIASNLPLAVRQSSDPNLYEFGVVWNGVFTVIGSRSKGAVDADHAAAAKATAAAPPPPPPDATG